MTKIRDYLGGLGEIAERSAANLRALIDNHEGEKGRAIEYVVYDLLKTVLPKRFSVGTGFVVDSKGNVSSQCDIVVYDNFQNSPAMINPSLGYFPIETVFAVIEVKTNLDSKGVRQTAKAIGRIRAMKLNKIYRVLSDHGEMRSIEFKSINLAPRSYLFSLDAGCKTSLILQETLKQNAEKYKAFFHGVLVAQKGWYIRQHATSAGTAAEFSELGNSRRKSDAFCEFAQCLINDLGTFPMYPADMAPYLDLPGSVR